MFYIEHSQLHYCCDHLLYLWLSSPSVSKRYDLELLVFHTDLWFLIIPLSSSLRFSNMIVTLQKEMGSENAITQEPQELNGHENEWIYMNTKRTDACLDFIRWRSYDIIC